MTVGFVHAARRGKLAVVVGLVVLMGLVLFGRTAAAQSPPSTFGVWAAQSVTIGANSTLVGTDVGVYSTGTPVEVQIGASVAIDGARAIYGHTVSLGDLASVGNIYTSDLVVDTGSNAGVYRTLSAFSAIPTPPGLGPDAPQTSPLTVAANTTVEISPGSYGAVTVGTNATLQLSGGLYDVYSISIASGGALTVEAPSLLRVASLFTDSYG